MIEKCVEFKQFCLKNEGRERMVVVVSEERETIKKSRKFDIVMKCSLK